MGFGEEAASSFVVASELASSGSVGMSAVPVKAFMSSAPEGGVSAGSSE